MDASDAQSGEARKAMEADSGLQQHVQALRDVFAHLYDYGYLRDHELVQRLAAGRFESSDLAVQHARSELLKALEQLRPPSHVSPRDRQWRPYDALYGRYVIGKELGELADDMSLSTRQVQREQSRGLEAIVANLDIPAAGEGQADGKTDAALLCEIARASSAGTFDCAQHACRAVDTASALLQAHAIVLSHAMGSHALVVQGDASAFRQMLISTLSFYARSFPGARMRIAASAGAAHTRINLTVSSVEDQHNLGELPIEVSVLARSQGWQVEEQQVSGSRCTSFVLPCARGMPLVALVEDNDDLVALLQRYLGMRGYRLVAIGDSPQAFTTIKSLMPDIIVLDVMMRHVDGWELLQRLGTDLELRNVPKIVCSVLNEPEMAKHLGADAYLKKPIRPLQFMRCLEQVGPGQSPHSERAGNRQPLPPRE